MEQVIRRMRVSRARESAALTDFWRDHGRRWAMEEAEYADVQTLAGLYEQVSILPEKDRVGALVGELKQIWRNGFSNPAEAFGWNEMNDGLPDSAFLAFAGGVHSVWAEIKDQI